MNYYILQQDSRIPDQPSILRCPEGINPEAWIDGKNLPDPGSIRFVLSPRSSEFRGGIIGGLVTLFHERFIDELTRLGVDKFTHFRVELEAPDGIIEHKYSLINIIELLEAVDEKESIVEPSATGGRGWLKSFKIDPVKARGNKIFRIIEAPTLIIIDETLRDNLLAFGAPGVRMLPTDRYDGWG